MQISTVSWPKIYVNINCASTSPSACVPLVILNCASWCHRLWGYHDSWIGHIRHLCLYLWSWACWVHHVLVRAHVFANVWFYVILTLACSSLTLSWESITFNVYIAIRRRYTILFKAVSLLLFIKFVLTNQTMFVLVTFGPVCCCPSTCS